MIVEINATDGDAGLQAFLDGEAWQSMTITGPDGQAIVAVNVEGRRKNYGLTELFSESSEPSFDVSPPLPGGTRSRHPLESTSSATGRS